MLQLTSEQTRYSTVITASLDGLPIFHKPCLEPASPEFTLDAGGAQIVGRPRPQPSPYRISDRIGVRAGRLRLGKVSYLRRIVPRNARRIVQEICPNDCRSSPRDPDP